jgi:hypothetical protein
MFSLAVTSRKSWESVKVVPRERLLREPDGTLVTSLQKSAVQREVLSTWTVWREVEGKSETSMGGHPASPPKLLG